MDSTRPPFLCQGKKCETKLTRTSASAYVDPHHAIRRSLPFATGLTVLIVFHRLSGEREADRVGEYPMRKHIEGEPLGYIPTAILSLAILLSPGAAQPAARAAQKSYVTDQVNPSPDAGMDRGEWSVAFYLGGAHTADSALTIRQPALATLVRFEDVSFDGRSFDGPLYYGIRGGRFLPGIPFLGIEAEFIHLKVFADPKQRVQAAGTRLGEPIRREIALGEMVQRYSISHGANLLLFNVAGRYRMHRGRDNPAGRLILIGRFGAGPTFPHTESTIEGKNQEQYEVGSVAWQLAGGAELHLWKGLYALGEYKFTRTRQKGKVFSGRAESVLRSHHGVFGLSYHF